MYYLYVAIISLLMPVEFGRLKFKSFVEPGIRPRLKGTFNTSSDKLFVKPVIWIHAVSVGEVQACKKLIAQLNKRHPQYQIVVTTVTTTGAQSVGQSLAPDVFHQYLPYDHPYFVNRFLDAINPAILVVAETEIWPVLYYQCRKRDVPVIIINARMTNKSFQRYRLLRRLSRQTLGHVNAIVAQSQTNADRFKELVTDNNKVSVNKNLKFDLTGPDSNVVDLDDMKSFIRGRQVIIAASTHPGEELVLTKVFKEVEQTIADCFFMMVPRHPERAKDIGRIAGDVGFNPVYSSDKPAGYIDCNLFIVDEIGLLPKLFRYADLVIMGGSFVPIGGHNMLEPAMDAKAIITGPFVDNFHEIYELLHQADGILKVKNDADLLKKIHELLNDEHRRGAMGRRARDVVLQNQGGTENAIKLIEGFLFARPQK